LRLAAHRRTDRALRDPAGVRAAVLAGPGQELHRELVPRHPGRTVAAERGGLRVPAVQVLEQAQLLRLAEAKRPPRTGVRSGRLCFLERGYASPARRSASASAPCGSLFPPRRSPPPPPRPSRPRPPPPPPFSPDCRWRPGPPEPDPAPASSSRRSVRAM